MNISAHSRSIYQVITNAMKIASYITVYLLINHHKYIIYIYIVPIKLDRKNPVSLLVFRSDTLSCVIYRSDTLSVIYRSDTL